MSDLCLVAAMLARVNTLDQPSTTDPDLPVLGRLSAQTRHQSLTPAALTLHQASIETYAAEFSQTQGSPQAPPPPAVDGGATWGAQLTIAAPEIQAPEPSAPSLARPLPNLAIGETSTQLLALRSRNPLKQLSLRPLIDPKGGGSIVALPSATRPLALKLHQASIETYAQAIAQAPARVAPLAQSQREGAASPAGASLTAATQVLGMAQAAGAAGAWQTVSQTSATLQPPSAARAAIALDQQVKQAQYRQAVDHLVAQSIHYPVAQPGCREAQQIARRSEASSMVQARLQAPPPLAHPSPRAFPSPLPDPDLTLAVAPSGPTAPLPWAPRGPLATPQTGPRSGPQLYQQRWAALQQGRLYSRLPIDSFQATWQAVQQQPSYSQWKQLLALEARAAGRGQGSNRLSVVLGDSLSLWLPMQQLPSSQLWLNQGISGDTTRGILQRLDSLQATRPTSIYLMAGVNDLKNGASDAEVLNNLQQIMRQLRRQHPQAKVYVQSILPAAIASPPGRIRSINQRLSQLARAEQVGFIDLYPQFAGPNDQLLASLTTDGIHLSPQGYSLWQSVLRNLETWASTAGEASSSS